MMLKILSNVLHKHLIIKKEKKDRLNLSVFGLIVRNVEQSVLLMEKEGSKNHLSYLVNQWKIKELKMEFSVFKIEIKSTGIFLLRKDMKNMG